MKPKTYVTIVLDSSGSMERTKQQTILGYNEQVQQLKADAKDQEIYASLVTFNGAVFEHQWNAPAHALKEANADDYCPNGSTALYDAVGYTLDKLQSTVEDTPETAYLVVIISDGMENASRHHNAGALGELMASLQKTERWTFTYMGCDENYIRQVAQRLSIPLSNTARWRNDTGVAAARAFTHHRDGMAHYMAARRQSNVLRRQMFTEQLNEVANFTEEISKDKSKPQPVQAKPKSDRRKATAFDGGKEVDPATEGAPSKEIAGFKETTR